MTDPIYGRISFSPSLDDAAKASREMGLVGCGDGMGTRVVSAQSLQAEIRRLRDGLLALRVGMQSDEGDRPKLLTSKGEVDRSKVVAYIEELLYAGSTGLPTPPAQGDSNARR